MSANENPYWADFDKSGETQVLHDLSGHVYGEDRTKAAQLWLSNQASIRASLDSAKTLDEANAANASALEANALAREANALAREANTVASSANVVALAAAQSARESAAAARTNNIIATLALIAAVVAIAISVISFFLQSRGD